MFHHRGTQPATLFLHETYYIVKLEILATVDAPDLADQRWSSGDDGDDGDEEDADADEDGPEEEERGGSAAAVDGALQAEVDDALPAEVVGGARVLPAEAVVEASVCAVCVAFCLEIFLCEVKKLARGYIGG